MKNQSNFPAGFDLAAVLDGHSDIITAIEWSTDGKLLVSSSKDNTVRIWNVGTGISSHTFRPDGSRPNSKPQRSKEFLCASLSPDMTKLAAGSTNKSLYIWDVKHEQLIRIHKEHQSKVNNVCWAPDNLTLASPSGENLLLWHPTGKRSRQLLRGPGRYQHIRFLHRGRDEKIILSACDNGIVQRLDLFSNKSIRYHSDFDSIESFLCVDESPDGRYIAAGSNRKIITVWDTVGRQAFNLEGHTDNVVCLSFSFDGTTLASKGNDDTVRLWDCGTWDTISILREHSVDHGLHQGGLAFHPEKDILATLSSDSKSVRVWNLNLDAIRANAHDFETIHYTSAKIVFVGESNVGKSCLALRISEDDYSGEMESTHAIRFWTMSPKQLDPETVIPVGQKRDIIFWDMGGQDEYRMVHQLFLHDATLALVMFDPTRGRTAFEEVEGWNKRLERQLNGRDAVKLLVGTKSDLHSGTSTLDLQAIDKLCHKCGFIGYFPTSSKNGSGMSELKAAITKHLNWTILTKTSRPELFQRIRDEIEERRKKKEVVLLISDLTDCISQENPIEFDSRTIGVVVEQLAMQGLIADTKLASGERVIVLQIEEVEKYAGSLIMLARNNMRGVPAIEERMVASQTMHFPGIAETERLNRFQERIVLECVVQLLLEHGICLRHEGLLIFPSLFQPTESAESENVPHPISLYYDFAGAIDNIYSALVAWLAVSQQFGQMRLWESRAEFEILGKGTCGLRKVTNRDGFAHLDVYFDDRTPKATHQLFIDFVEQHLQKHGVEIREHVEVTCLCGFKFAENSIRRRLANDAHDIICPECENRNKIMEGAEKNRDNNPNLSNLTWALRTKIEERKKAIVSESKKTFKQPDAQPSKEPYRVLHLSDLHFGPTQEPIEMLQPLISDLRDKKGGLGFKDLDYLVVSGDMTNRATATEFEKARIFVSELIREFNLTAQRCVLIPGNHDINWEEEVYEWKPSRHITQAQIKSGQLFPQGDGFLVRNDNNYNSRFKNFSDHFYHPLTQAPYPLKPTEQSLVLTFAETKIQFLALNSEWEIDEHFPDRASINPTSLAHGLTAAEEQITRMRRNNEIGADEEFLKIAVWHHPVTGNEKIASDAFLEQLQKANFKVCLHGHVHEDRADLVNYVDRGRQLHVVGAGSFGAPTNARPESTPRLYNVLEIQRDLAKVRVRTRALAKEGGAWKGWPAWPSKNPDQNCSYYDFDL